ncbi:enoyl-CoA hydratase-related protein [Gallaecimonas xiamenensis]|uniref:Enoyl-CoA hydratase/isomerase n=1 Tax=Gallaecimonas xiamenensis 3-C-1 TaxID=745411 RepID=K2K8X9_9GAMM|nr:enoyl-CoA hydratase-related protein [Gallaecimonas xiamenensis]EKE73730.1 enoyl-CoA hydratase/isomerase [Gallaecimonas xiamenensis 3-C-1]
MTDFVKTALEGGVLKVSLERFDKKNALTQAMYDGLTAALRQAESDQAVKVVLLQGNDQVFCAGNDLEDFLSLKDLGEDSPILRFLTTLVRFKKPLLAAVAGPAVGIGTTVLLHCDLVVAQTGSRFQLPFVALGLCAEAGSSLLLAKRIGQAKANEWLLTGKAYSAEEALSQGLINQVVEGDVCATGLALAKQLAQLPSDALATTKALIRAPYQKEAEKAIADEAREFVRLLQGDECKAAVKAFFTRR